MDAERRLERSNHTAFLDDHIMYVWGGYQVVDGNDVVCPSDEIWLFDLDCGTWERREITGDIPPELSGFCGSYVNGTLYIFAGCDPYGYTNHMFSVDLTEQPYTWREVTNTGGNKPSPRSKHTCWVHRDRLIYFGGYACKTLQEVRNTSSSNFIVEETSWTAIGNTLFRCWGWNNEVSVFDIHTATWSMPETQGPTPAPRGFHATAVLGNKGFISGGLETKELDLFCLDLETWTWTQFDLPASCVPPGRSMHTMTPTSDHTLFLFGGLGTSGNPLCDAWCFDSLKGEWTERTHPHSDKPRLWHTACQGRDDDVVVFGGSRNYCVLMDSVAVLRSPWQQQCNDVFMFQTQPYSLSRLCEDFIGRRAELFRELLDWLPSKLQRRLDKRLTFFSADKPMLKQA
ncbi:kelch domain-containing protein 1-like [Myripristis murdjan]|uniref:Kelch domain-containing protein 1-like n=1 Tax=Myripristis murdjan TaxID=586833 RepID=A0A668AJY3_9TELE|nr:kelch domain-containing protein 1-like [Myripristis murdjan]XP_029934177.1 kelch domain-containing protein 1-like [Myripristis murdjan]XP_029934178.1 kelch domain-containing protein 1-like [Myripristis murdjan]XP_029934179.1 kelch domain-containing protein 1-like [Myripristis murdjan]